MKNVFYLGIRCSLLISMLTCTFVVTLKKIDVNPNLLSLVIIYSLLFPLKRRKNSKIAIFYINFAINNSFLILIVYVEEDIIIHKFTITKCTLNSQENCKRTFIRNFFFAIYRR